MTSMDEDDLACTMDEDDPKDRYDAAMWLRKRVGVVAAKDLPAEPSEEAFRLGLRSGMILCNVVNKIQKGSVPKVVDAPSAVFTVPDTAAQAAYLENIKNFNKIVEALGLPTFDPSDLEQEGDFSRVVDTVLALKAYSEWKGLGGNESDNFTWTPKASPTKKTFARRNSEPLMSSLSRTQSISSDLSLDTSVQDFDDTDFVEESESGPLYTIVCDLLEDRHEEDIPKIIENILNKLKEEFESRLEEQTKIATVGTDDMSEEDDEEDVINEEYDNSEDEIAAKEQERLDREKQKEKARKKEEEFFKSAKEQERINREEELQAQKRKEEEAEVARAAEEQERMNREKELKAQKRKEEEAAAAARAAECIKREKELQAQKEKTKKEEEAVRAEKEKELKAQKELQAQKEKARKEEEATRKEKEKELKQREKELQKQQEKANKEDVKKFAMEQERINKERELLEEQERARRGEEEEERARLAEEERVRQAEERERLEEEERVKREEEEERAREEAEERAAVDKERMEREQELLAQQERARKQEGFRKRKDEYNKINAKTVKRRELLEHLDKEIRELKSALPSKTDVLLMQKTCQEEAENLGKYVHTLCQAAAGYKKVLDENRKLYNQVQDLKGSIRVYCRIRPFFAGRENRPTSVDYTDEETVTIIFPTKSGREGRKASMFNKVFGPSATQEEVFSDTQPLIRSVLDGFNVCLFAFGQTGSGKTYTLTGPDDLTPETMGVNYRALNDLFLISEERKNLMAYEISINMLEIYNDEIRDLLVTDGTAKIIDICNGGKKGINVPDANRVPVSSTDEVIDQMNLCKKNRAGNDHASRSHSFLTVHVFGKDLTSGTTIKGCMHLVDLAGSERADEADDEAKKSLSALGDVLVALANKSSRVPYKTCKLTQLLQEAIGAQAKILMFVHVHPDADEAGETLNTFKFIERFSTVEGGAGKSPEVREMKEQIALLKAALAKKEGGDPQWQELLVNSPRGGKEPGFGDLEDEDAKSKGSKQPSKGASAKKPAAGAAAPKLTKQPTTLKKKGK